MSYPLPTMQAPRGEMSPALAATLGAPTPALGQAPLNGGAGLAMSGVGFAAWIGGLIVGWQMSADARDQSTRVLAALGAGGVASFGFALLTIAGATAASFMGTQER